MGSVDKIFRHRVSAICVASLSTLALGLTIGAGSSNQFLKIKHEDSHSPMMTENDIISDTTNNNNNNNHSMEDLHQMGLFTSSSTNHSFEGETMWRVARGFYVFSSILLGMLVLFAWAVSFLIRPTHRRWKSLSIAAIAIAGIQVPVFLLFEARACTGIEGQTCTLGNGFFLMLWSVISLVVVMGLTQWWAVPIWWDVLKEWKVNNQRMEELLENQLEYRGVAVGSSSQYNNNNNDGFGLMLQPAPSQVFGTATKFDRWFIGVRRKIEYHVSNSRFRHVLIRNDSFYDDLPSSSDIEDGNKRGGGSSSSGYSIDNSRLMLSCVTPDGKVVGDDRESQHSFDVRMEEHEHSNILSDAGSCTEQTTIGGRGICGGGALSPYRSGDDSSDTGSNFSIGQHSSTSDLEMQSHDGIPAQFSPARRAAALGHDINSSSSTTAATPTSPNRYGMRSLSPFPVQELNASSKRKGVGLRSNGRPPLAELKAVDVLNESNLSEEGDIAAGGLSKEVNGLSSQGVVVVGRGHATNDNENENDKASDCSLEYKSSYSLNSNTNEQRTDDIYEPIPLSSIRSEVDNLLQSDLKQITDDPSYKDKNMDKDDSSISDFMSTCSVETEEDIGHLLQSATQNNSYIDDDDKQAPTTNTTTTLPHESLNDNSAKLHDEEYHSHNSDDESLNDNSVLLQQEEYHSQSESKGSISLDEAIVAGANAAEESNNSTTSDRETESSQQSVSDLDEPEPTYYSSDESVTSSLSISTYHSLSTYQNDAGASNSECDTLSESESNSKQYQLPLVQSTHLIPNNNNSSPMSGLQHSNRGSRRSKKKYSSARSVSSVCSKRSLLDYTIDEETDFDIEREKESDNADGETDHLYPEDMVVGGSPFKIQTAAVVSPMRGGLGSASTAFQQKISAISPKDRTTDEQTGVQTDSYHLSTPSRVVSPTLISSDESSDGKEKEQEKYDGGNDIVKSRILRRKKRRAQVEGSLRNQTCVLPVVSPTNGDNKGHTNLVDEDASVGSFDYPIISIRMKSSRRESLKYNMHNTTADDDNGTSSGEDNSYLSGSVKARSARRKRLQRETLNRSHSEKTVRTKNDILTISSIVQDYGSDEASL